MKIATDVFHHVQMFSPLHTAAASGQISVVRLLLELGVEVDAVNVHGNSALHIACLNGQDVVVSKLLEYEATVNSINNKGMVRKHFLICIFDLPECLCFPSLDKSSVCLFFGPRLYQTFFCGTKKIGSICCYFVKGQI